MLFADPIRARLTIGAMGRESVLALCRPRCQLIVAAGKKGKGANDASQARLNDDAVHYAMLGLHVVRLKQGDPFIFGRGGEEVVELRKQGFNPRVVPGITSATAGPAAAGIPVLMRGFAHQLHISTAAIAKTGDTPELQPFAEGHTYVFLMGMSSLRKLCAELQGVGFPPDLPAAVIQNATLPSQRCESATVETLADAVEAAGMGSPAVLVFGAAVTALNPSTKQPEPAPSLARAAVIGAALRVPEEQGEQGAKGPLDAALDSVAADRSALVDPDATESDAEDSAPALSGKGA